MITVPMKVAVSDVSIPINVSATNVDVPLNISAKYTITNAEEYDGEYEVMPRLYEQSLATNGKIMNNNVTVYEIPVTYTTNPTGSKTVIIG